MKVPLIDLTEQYHQLKDEIDEAVRQVLESGRYILGPNVEALEQEVAHYSGTRYAVGVASGTDALLLSLKALNIGPGDEVIVPTYTFFATVEVVVRLGATPIFVDIDENSYCLDVSQVEERITPRTRAVIPVHLFGHPADMAPLLDLAAQHNLSVIEDNAQAFGAEYRGQKTGSLGDAGCLSFFPTKNLGGLGDGGMITTNEPEVARRVQILRNHGCKNKSLPVEIGYNSRLDEIQAAILLVKLPYVDEWNNQRRMMAKRYTQELSGLGLEFPDVRPGCLHAYHMYVIRVGNRAEVQRHLQEAGIGSAIYYPQPLHLTEACSFYRHAENDFPHAEKASQETLALPLYPGMTKEELNQVICRLQEAVGNTTAFSLRYKDN